MRGLTRASKNEIPRLIASVTPTPSLGNVATNVRPNAREISSEDRLPFPGSRLPTKRPFSSRCRSSRVEVMTRLEDGRLKRRVRDEILAACLADNVKARELDASGRYHRVPREPNEPAINSQECLL